MKQPFAITVVVLVALEVFASDGLTYVPMLFTPKADDLALGVQVKGGSAKMAALHVHELRSAWTSQ